MPMMGSTMASVNATVAALEYISTPLDADATTGMSCRGERSLLLVLVSELDLAGSLFSDHSLRRYNSEQTGTCPLGHTPLLLCSPRLSKTHCCCDLHHPSNLLRRRSYHRPSMSLHHRNRRPPSTSLRHHNRHRRSCLAHYHRRGRYPNSFLHRCIPRRSPLQSWNYSRHSRRSMLWSRLSAQPQPRLRRIPRLSRPKHSGNQGSGRAGLHLTGALPPQPPRPERARMFA